MNRENKINNINPLSAPEFTLANGDKIPCIGLGTFGSDVVTHQTVADTVKKAVMAGYRHIDCASVYGNEAYIGAALNELISGGKIKRDELWITSKVWNDMHDHVKESCKKSIEALNCGYLDLYLVHWPFPNFHPPHCDVAFRSPDAKSYIHENYMRTWRQMEDLVKAGLVRNIGTSNMTIPKLKLLLRDAEIKPVCNEMELHPHFQQEELFNFCIENNIQPIAYCPLGSPARPERDRTEQDTVDLEDEVIIKIAERLNITPAAVAIQWAVKRGQLPIPFSVNHFYDNLQAAANIQLTEADMEEISMIDKNCRLIKGQVFCWKDNQSWEDLWDLTGEITPA